MWSIDLPNAFNFGFDYFLFCLLAVVIYIPGISDLKLILQTSVHQSLTIVCRFPSVVSAHAQSKKEGAWPAKAKDTLIGAAGHCFKVYNTALS